MNIKGQYHAPYGDEKHDGKGCPVCKDNEIQEKIKTYNNDYLNKGNIRVEVQGKGLIENRSIKSTSRYDVPGDCSNNIAVFSITKLWKAK